MATALPTTAAARNIVKSRESRNFKGNEMNASSVYKGQRAAIQLTPGNGRVSAGYRMEVTHD